MKKPECWVVRCECGCISVASWIDEPKHKRKMVYRAKKHGTEIEKYSEAQNLKWKCDDENCIARAMQKVNAWKRNKGKSRGN